MGRQMPVKREPFGMFLVMVDPNSKFEKLLGVAAMAPYFIMCATAPVSHHRAPMPSSGPREEKRTNAHSRYTRLCPCKARKTMRLTVLAHGCRTSAPRIQTPAKHPKALHPETSATNRPPGVRWRSSSSVAASLSLQSGWQVPHQHSPTLSLLRPAPTAHAPIRSSSQHPSRKMRLH